MLFLMVLLFCQRNIYIYIYIYIEIYIEYIEIYIYRNIYIYIYIYDIYFWKLLCFYSVLIPWEKQ